MEKFVRLLKDIIYVIVRGVSVLPRVSLPLRNLCQYYIRCYEGYSYDMAENGERQILASLYPDKKNSKLVFFDVGANKGGWSRIAKNIFPNVRIHCFEPSSDTFKILIADLASFDDIKKNNFALSNMHTQLSFNNYGHGSGRNSFVQNPSYPHGPVEIVEKVDVWTAKEYIERENIAHIDFMKIDVEGWEYYVLLGLEEYLNPEFVSVIQFEYGYAHGDSKTLMKDFYKLLEGKGYRIGKLKKNKVEFTPFIYHLNNFESGPNFIACHPDFQGQLSRFSER